MLTPYVLNNHIQNKVLVRASSVFSGSRKQSVAPVNQSYTYTQKHSKAMSLLREKHMRDLLKQGP